PGPQYWYTPDLIVRTQRHGFFATNAAMICNTIGAGGHLDLTLQWQFDGSALLSGAVDGQDHLDRPAALPTINLRLPALLNGLYEVGQLPSMTLVGNRCRVAGAAGGAHLFGKALFDVPVLRRFWQQVPAQDVLLLDDGRAAVTMNGDGLGQSGVNAGGGLND